MTAFLFILAVLVAALIWRAQGRQEQTRRNLREFQRIECRTPRIPGDFDLC